MAYPLQDEEADEQDKRRARRLRQDLGINEEGVEVVLRLCRQVMDLETRLEELEIELNRHRTRNARHMAGYRFYYEATWRELYEDENEE